MQEFITVFTKAHHLHLSYVASTKETTLIRRISDVVRPRSGTNFVAYKE
jgi:hypothetical protein